MNVSTVLSIIERPLTGAPLERPAAGEHDPYYSRYIDRVPAGDFLALLRSQVDAVASLFGQLTPAQADFAYAAGKWTVKEVLGHLIDVERVFAFRAASISRHDPSALPNFDQDAWVPPARLARRTLEHLLAEWIVARTATILLVEGLPPESQALSGTVSNKPMSVRALLYVLPGHVDYHLEKTRELYVGAASWPR